MVNSGSSANLLAIAGACAPNRNERLYPGDEVLVPSVCWSTTISPLIQYGLITVFMDVNPNTLNVRIDNILENITDKTRAIMMGHRMGNTSEMNKILQLCKDATIY